jgi:beta-glucosidase/6-phospho-beta-glucosidase/beta-galactosidase
VSTNKFEIFRSNTDETRADSYAEWSDGYGPRFGVTFTDYETLQRTPKKSALLLAKMVADRQGIQVA